MKMLVHRTPNVDSLPVEFSDLKAHLRIADASEDLAIFNIGFAAAAEIEHFAQIALMTQTIRVTIFEPEPGTGLILPIGPVADDQTPTIMIDGAMFSDFDFVGGNRPFIRWSPEYHSLTPSQVTIEYEAGFGASASSVPSDLSQAILDQSALHYDGRSPMDAKSLTTSPHMARIGARYRGVQL